MPISKIKRLTKPNADKDAEQLVQLNGKLACVS